MSKVARFTRSLIGLSLLVGCSAPQMMPPGMGGTPNPALFNQFNTFQAASSSDSLLLTDNFANWMRNKERSDGFQDPAQTEPIQGTEMQKMPAPTSRNLTYMTYEALDNNLHGDLNRILDTLELVGSNPKMNLLAQTDNFGPGNAARYFIDQHTEMGEIVAPYQRLGDAGENSADPNVFASAVNWAFNAYPAQHNWLNISTHGMGFAGINYDDTPQQSQNIIQFSQALKAGLGGKKLDILSFDACLMATVEVGSELQDSANILVGSEDSTYYWGYGYYKTFSKIAQSGTMNPDQVARSMVVDINGQGKANMTLTISATDLRKIGLLEQELDKLARALRRALPQHKAGIIRAAQASKEFHLAENIPFRDINRVVSLFKRFVPDAEVQAACDSINDVMYRRGVIMFARQNKIEDGQGRGLSIYLPSDGKMSQLYRQTRFAKTTQWDEFLVELSQAIAQG